MSGGQRYDIELKGRLHVTSLSQVPLICCVETRCRNSKPQTIQLNRSCQLGEQETASSVKELWSTFELKKISLASNYMAASATTKRLCLGEHLKKRNPPLSCKDSISSSNPFCMTYKKWECVQKFWLMVSLWVVSVDDALLPFSSMWATAHPHCLLIVIYYDGNSCL